MILTLATSSTDYGLGLEAVVLNSRLAEHHEIGLLPNNRLSGYPRSLCVPVHFSTSSLIMILLYKN